MIQRIRRRLPPRRNNSNPKANPIYDERESADRMEVSRFTRYANLVHRPGRFTLTHRLARKAGFPG